jgi:hypothetical protein
MIKKKVAVSGFIGLILLCSLSYGVEIRLRLASGLLKQNPEEINLALAGWQQELETRSEAFDYMDYISGEAAELRLSLLFEAELLLSFSPRLALGVSGGYGYAEVSEEDTLLTYVQDGVTYNRARPTKISAYPFALSAYYFFPLSSKLSAYLRAGAGYILAKYVGREALKKESETRYVYPSVETAEAGRAAFLGGLGLGYQFDPNFGFFIEATAHSARVSGFEGVNTLQQDGSLFAYEEYISDLDIWQAKLGVLPEAPADSAFRSVREAVIDLSGFSVKMGIALKF